MMRMRPLLHAVRRFMRDARGVAATEFILIAPLLFLVLLGTFTLFDWLRASYVTERATFTVGDLMSRQTERDEVFLGRVKETFFKLAVNDVGDPQLRIMSLLRTSEGYVVDWTYNSGSGALARQPVPYDLLPDIAVYDSVIVTQSSVKIVPTFSFLFDVIQPERAENGYQIEMSYTASTRPRFVSRIAKVQ